jgi:phenylacetate-CoA ligase
LAGKLDALYGAAPAWMQDLMIAGFGWMWRRRRYGAAFHRELPRILEREGWNRTQFEEFQADQLGRLTVWAASQTPYYREAFQKAGVQPADIRELSDLRRLPVLTRTILRTRGEDLTVQSIPRRRLHFYRTSGSSNAPLTIAYGPETHAHWTAYYEARCRRWAGVSWMDSRSTVGGRLIVSKKRTSPPFWKYNPIERQLYLSAFHISHRNIPSYARALREYAPRYHSGYAASTYFMASLLEEIGDPGFSMKAVITSSEPLAARMRECLSRVFHAPVFDTYSAVEACCLASECGHGSMHVSPDVGIVELLDDQGNPVPPGRTGEIVATGLLNWAQPLIRYRTGDLAAWSDQACPCGRAMPVLTGIEGRLEDAVIAPDGSLMVRFHGVFYGVDHMREAQVVQEELDRFRVRVAAAPGFGDIQRKKITENIRARVGAVKVEFEIVEALERTARGKVKAVISKVNPAGKPRAPLADPRRPS